MKVLLLANPGAHGGRARRMLPPLCDFISSRVAQFEYRAPTSAGELREIARRAAHGGYDRVLVAGGDGTAHEAVNGLCGSVVPLGVIPLGNGNDLCQSLGIPLDPIAAAKFLLEAPVASIDVVRAGEEVYAGVAGVGFDAETNRRANSWPEWPRGHLRYWLAAFTTMLTYAPERFTFTADSEEFSGEALWITFANSPYYGGGLRIAPQANLRDGLLDVCVIEPVTFTELLDLYPALFAGQHLASPHVRTFRAQEVEVRAPRGTKIFGDGEYVGEAPFRLKVEPRALCVLGAW